MLDGRLEVWIDLVGRGDRRRIRGVEAVARREQRLVDVDLVGLRQVIAVAVDPRILDPARRRARVGVADVGADRRQLSGIAAEAGAQDRLARPRRARRSARRAA